MLAEPAAPPYTPQLARHSAGLQIVYNRSKHDEGDAMAAKLRWGILGLGRFGRVHARALQAIPEVELVAICNRNPARLREAAQEFPEPRSYEDADALLQDPELDAVTIVTHYPEHCALAIAALEAGKHVFLEKPMAANPEECDRILEAWRASQRQLLVGHICRFDPRVSLAKEAVAAGRIGRIVSMHARRNLPLAPGNIRLDKISPWLGDGIHDIDLMLWFLDRLPERVYGKYVRFGEFKYPEVGWGMLEFGNDCVGIIETNWGLPRNVPTVIDACMELVGTEGKLTIDCSETGLSILDRDGSKAVDTDYWPVVHGSVSGVLTDELRYFVRCIREHRPPTVITPEEAALAVQVVASLEASAATGQPQTS